MKGYITSSSIYPATSFIYANLRVEKSHFRGDPRYGRSTKLVEMGSGIVLIECMGVCTKRELWAAYARGH